MERREERKRQDKALPRRRNRSGAWDLENDGLDPLLSGSCQAARRGPQAPAHLNLSAASWIVFRPESTFQYHLSDGRRVQESQSAKGCLHSLGTVLTVLTSPKETSLRRAMALELLCLCKTEVLLPGMRISGSGGGK